MTAARLLPLWIADQVRNDGPGVYVMLVSPTCGYWIKSSMTVRDAGNDGRPSAAPLDCGSSPQ